MPSGNPQNLIPTTSMSPEERKIMASKAGKASVEARRAKKDAKETAKLFLELMATGELNKNLAKLNVAEKERTNQMGIVARLTLKAQSGDVNSAKLLWELTGQLPKQGENNFNVNIVKDEEENVVIVIPDNGRDKT